jgi:predicted nucleic acid-binding protein
VEQFKVGKTFYERAVMIDTGPLIAMYDPSDKRGEDVQSILHLMYQRNIPLYITQLTIAETHRRILYDLGYKLAYKFVDSVTDGTVNILVASSEDITKAIEIITRYTDQTITLTDAVSMALMLRLGIKDVLSFDWHFSLLNFNLVSTGNSL